MPTIALGEFTAIAGRALSPHLHVSNDEALDDVRVLARICTPTGEILVAQESIAFDLAPGEPVDVYPVQSDPIPTHPAWQGPHWLEINITRYGRTLLRESREFTFIEPLINNE